MNPIRFVSVTVIFDESGKMIPKIIHWDESHDYKIENIRRIQPAASLKNGIDGDRYTVYIKGRETFLYFSHSMNTSNLNSGRWYVKLKQ